MNREWEGVTIPKENQSAIRREWEEGAQWHRGEDTSAHESLHMSNDVTKFESALLWILT